MKFQKEKQQLTLDKLIELLIEARKKSKYDVAVQFHDGKEYLTLDSIGQFNIIPDVTFHLSRIVHDSKITRGETEEHPENICQRCEGINFAWNAPNVLWNSVMRDRKQLEYKKWNIICPNCFLDLYEAKFGKSMFTVVPMATFTNTQA